MLRNDLKANPSGVFKITKFKQCVDGCTNSGNKKECATKCSTQYAYFKTGHHQQQGRKSQGFRK